MKIKDLKDALDIDGKPENKHEIGSLYYRGNNPAFSQDLEGAFELFQSAAEKNYAPSQYMSGLMLINGEGVKKDLDAGFGMIKQASGNGNVAAVFYEANAYFDGNVGTGTLPQNYTRAFELYSKISEGDVKIPNIVAQSNYRLAKIYQSGEGIEKADPLMALQCYEKAALAGSRESAVTLERSYLDSTAPNKFEMAFKWAQDIYKLSPKENPDLGTVNSLRDIALMKFYGKGTELDVDNAVVLFEKVTELTNAPLVSYLLAKTYAEGEKVEKNMEKAIAHLKKSADAGYADAALTYGIMLEQGVSEGDVELLSSDEFEATQYYTVAAKTNDVAKSLIQDLKDARKNRADVNHGDVSLDDLMFANADFEVFAAEAPKTDAGEEVAEQAVSEDVVAGSGVDSDSQVEETVAVQAEEEDAGAAVKDAADEASDSPTEEATDQDASADEVEKVLKQVVQEQEKADSSSDQAGELPADHIVEVGVAGDVTPQAVEVEA